MNDTTYRASRPGEPPHFVCRKFLSDDEVFGARWWHEGFVEAHASDAVGRRSAIRALLVLGGAASLLAVMPVVCRSCADDEKLTSMDALQLQRQQGWDVGEQGKTLSFGGITHDDVAGGDEWRDHVRFLAELMTPRDPSLVRYHVPTLLQAPSLPANASLASQLTPVRTERMDRAYETGQSLLAQFEAIEPFPTDTALILDMAGPVSVAAAAALAPRFEPVSLLDNWPHPRGVVPSQDALGAVLFFSPRFNRLKHERPRPAPPAFILDAARLSTPTGENVFDNRYMAKLPPVDGFRALGVKHVLYVVEQSPPSGRPVEEDDLNDDFVALSKGGIDVKILALDVLRNAVQLSAAATISAPDAGVAAAAGTTPHTHYHSPSALWFWSSYGWHSTAAPRRAGAVAAAPMPSAPAGAGYVPAPRPTVFSTRSVGGLSGIGKQRPSGFGLVSVRSSSDGRVGGWAGSSSRSSFGRSRSWSSG